MILFSQSASSVTRRRHQRRPVLAAALLAALAAGAPRRAASVLCASSVDDPAQIRWGSDIASVPLPAASNVADCIALCCTTPGCVSFSYNVPPQASPPAKPQAFPPAPPTNATCSPDNLVPCCHLKNAVPPLIPNPSPRTCQTGVLASANPAAGCVPPAPPTNASLALANGRVDTLDYHQAAGDTWAITTAADGNMYGVTGDVWRNDPTTNPPNDSCMSVWEIQGVPWLGGLGASYSADRIAPWRLFNTSYCAGVESAQNVKPSAPLGLPGGRIILGVVCVGTNYSAGSSGNQQNFASGIATSDDFGVTWNMAATPNNFFTGALAAPQFVQYGAGMAGAPDNASFVYAHFFCDAERKSAFWSQNDVALLGRVPLADVLNRSAWTFFAGSAQWSASEADAVEVLRYDGFLGQNIAAFNAFSKRYVMASWSFYAGDKPSGVCPSVAWFYPAARHWSQLIVFEAPAPEGPWRHFARIDNWLDLDAGYTPTLPTGWHSASDASMWLVHSGAWSSYNLATSRFVFDVL